MKRRQLWLLPLLLAGPARAADDGVRRGRPLAFARDHGAHLDTRTEWWYATGWLGRPEAPTHGFQVTFFRSRTGLAETTGSRFAARHLLFAHAALTDLGPRRHHHDQRIARWSGAGPTGGAAASSTDTAITLGRWRLLREAAEGGASVYRAEVDAGPAFTLDLRLRSTQPVLLQGDAGFSRKGPDEAQASHYYSQPQLAVDGRIGSTAVSGTAWLDHEWSEEILHPDAVGWDWIGINLFDGSALTAFRLRRADGSALWAGGSHRPAGGASRAFGPAEVHFGAGRRWSSPATGASYPVQWEIDTPAGRHTVRALMDSQELDSRGSTGTVYWEGLSELLDSHGRRVGLGYLEMTGYAGRLRL